MKFELLPVLDCMLNLYQLPANRDRFNEYLKILGTEKGGDLQMPISGFNPMAKTHVIEKLLAMKKLQAETIITETIEALNSNLDLEKPGSVFKIAFNLADDQRGGWTNRFTTDYDSKFKINALVSRNFCVPFFWTCELINVELIKSRTIAYAHRTLYWLHHQKPVTLKEHVSQEIYVMKHLPAAEPKESFPERDLMDRFYKNNEGNDNHSLIFNFFYGDLASKTLSFPCFDIPGVLPGFQYAQWLAQQTDSGHWGT